MGSSKDDLSFDPQALKQKYDAERDKRLRQDGNEQYVHMHGQFAHYIEDPYSERTPRAAVVEDVEVVILGGGFGGLLVAAKLKQAGIEDVRIVEKGADFGGTWYWNRYPGAACDTESYVYLPLLEEVGFMPTEKYSKAPEIWQHAKNIGKKFDLYPRALFQTVITELRWNEEQSRWLVATDRNDKIRARFVIICPGHYQEPKLPGIQGVETFKQHSFHTSRWDFEYTGGDTFGGLEKLSDKTVGIIGTGATAIQCVPHLGRWAEQLYVFQRTPSSVGVRGNHPTDVEWYKHLKHGWQRRRMDNFTGIFYGRIGKQDLVDDGWTKDLFAAFKDASPDMTDEERMELLQITDYKIMEDIRARVEDVVKDKETAEALKPWYNRACKRPCFHDEYLDTFNRPNVKLVDTLGRGVDRITENSVVVAGKEYRIDCLIYATGFDLSSFAGFDIEVFGKGGQSLNEKWKNGARTLHGMQSHGFPNFFVMSTLQSALDANFVHMLDEQAIHIAYILRETGRRGATRIEVTEKAEEAWVQTHLQFSEITVKTWAECTPSYFNNEGKISQKFLLNGPLGMGPPAFIDVLSAWREEGKLEGLALSN